jgi:alanyl-tRNA synthetase
MAKKLGSVLALVNPTVPAAVSFAVTDDLIARGKDANALMKLVTVRFEGRGGGRKTFASGSLGVPDATRVVTEELPEMLREWLAS